MTVDPPCPRGSRIDLGSFLTERSATIDAWWQAQPEGHVPHVGRTAERSPSEVLTLAMVAQWPHWRSERDCWRSADAHLRGAFPQVGSQSQLNRRVRTCRHSWFAGEATFGRCVSETEWVYGFTVARVIAPPGILTAFGLAPANGDERPSGEALITADRYPAYLAATGFASVPWEIHWRAASGSLVAATPTAPPRAPRTRPPVAGSPANDR